ncbi:replication protein A 70 kDa DNA-binding subunit B-like [Coffea arabica]|uniref:Replication protein A 70 kDa DNA-binding subunit B-like n=1 Tax=Coffea arabica TaxID=13443 RepID=A0ABM4UFE2_COFAR
MARRYLPVNEVVEGVKEWTVLAQVVERGHVQLSRGARPVNYRCFLLTDSKGTKVSAVIYGNGIHFFVGMLMPFRRYYISSAALQKAEPRYKYVEQVPPVIPCHFELTAFENLFKFADTENLQNIQGIVMHAFPLREQGLDSTTRDLVVINQEKRPMLLILWNEFEANEGAQLANTIANNIIIAMRVKVTTFNYLSLTTRLASCLLMNPSTSEATVLRQWYDQNRQQIAQLIEEGSYKDSTKLLPPPKNNDIISVENAVSMLKNVKTAWIRENTSLAAEQRSFWYAAYSNCQKVVDSNLEWIIKCPSCREESAVEAK